MSRRSFVTSAIFALGVTTGCTAQGPCSDDLGSASQPIVYGSPDTEHQAVVGVFQQPGNNQTFSCAGTIVEVKAGSGYVLTAAHCLAKLDAVGYPVTPIQPASLEDLAVVIGDDYLNTNDIHRALEIALHPDYDLQSNGWDFGMLRFSGADASTPTIPAVADSDDGLAVGTLLELVGYGVTEEDSSNSVRNHVVKPIESLDSNLITIDQFATSGGACEGDSGAPALTTEGPEMVVGVVSGGETGCAGLSYHGRVSSVYESFIVPFIDSSTGELTCDECWDATTIGAGSCVSVYDNCIDSSECIAFYSCYAGCSDSTCENTCLLEHPQGAAEFFAIYDCVCDTSCTTECADAFFCQQPTCGLSLSDPACGECSGSHCCSEVSACADEVECYACLEADPPPAWCLDNAARNALLDCFATDCTTECSTYHRCGLSGEQPCRGCYEEHCCPEALACATNETCAACQASAEVPAECDDNPPYQTLTTCLAGHCIDECGGGTGGAGGGNGGGEASPPPAADDDGGGCTLPAQRRSPGGSAALLLAWLGAGLGLGRRRRLGGRAVEDGVGRGPRTAGALGHAPG